MPPPNTTTISMETGSKGQQPFLIADSSGLISLTSDTDRNYPHALRAAQQLEETQATILVPYDVYAETFSPQRRALVLRGLQLVQSGSRG
jgi:hypothetical protein